MTSSVGLRDRKKAATRSALSEAAMKLTRTHGLESVTAEAIASEAGVSTRTFHNYFNSKEDAVLYQMEEQARAWVELLKTRPADEPIWDSLQQLAISVVSDTTTDLDEMCAIAEVVEQSPALTAKKLQLHSSISRIFGEALAERTGTDVDSDLYPNLLQIAVGGAVKTAIELSISGNAAGRTPEQLVAEAFDQLRRGLPDPRL